MFAGSVGRLVSRSLAEGEDFESGKRVEFSSCSIFVMDTGYVCMNQDGIGPRDWWVARCLIFNGRARG